MIRVGRALTATVLLGALIVLIGGLGACDPGAGAGSGASGELTVFAAASTTEAFEALAEDFERRRPGVTVRLNLAGSQQLASQILAGAPADVFASADPVQMQRVADQRLLASAPEVFARNAMAIAVPAGNPAGVSGPADLADDRLTVVLAAPEVPAGRYARQVLAEAGVAVSPASLEPDVRQALNKVALGEADAALVYASDLEVAGSSIEGVGVPERFDVTASYPIAVLEDAPSPGTARAFAAFVRSPVGRQVLSRFGFRTR